MALVVVLPYFKTTSQTTFTIEFRKSSLLLIFFGCHSRGPTIFKHNTIFSLNSSNRTKFMII